MGNYDYFTFVHEIGHTLGLDHGHDGLRALPTNHDSVEYSVMTYRSFVGADLNGYTVAEGSYPQTLMLDDIAALQYMYGADYTTNATNTTYYLDPDHGRDVRQRRRPGGARPRTRSSSRSGTAAASIPTISRTTRPT